MAISDEITKAIAAHGMWKHRLRTAIDTGRSDWNVAQVSVDNLCDFGKWLHSLPSGEKTKADWKTVQQLHAEFHKSASKVLDLATKGKKKEAEAAIAMGSDFANTSGKLTAAMTKWKSNS